MCVQFILTSNGMGPVVVFPAISTLECHAYNHGNDESEEDDDAKQSPHNSDKYCTRYREFSDAGGLVA